MVAAAVGRHPGMEVVGVEVGEPCPGHRVVVVEAEGGEPCLAVAVAEAVVVVAQASTQVLQVAAAEAAVEEEEEVVGEAQTKKGPQLWSDRGVGVEEEEVAVVAALGRWHLAAVGFPAASGPSEWLYLLWAAVRPLPDDHRSIWRRPASG